MNGQDILLAELQAAIAEMEAATVARKAADAAALEAFRAWEAHHTTCRDCHTVGVLACTTQVVLFARHEAHIYLRRTAQDRETRAKQTAQNVCTLRFDTYLKTPEGAAKFPEEAARRAADRAA